MIDVNIILHNMFAFVSWRFLECCANMLFICDLGGNKTEERNFIWITDERITLHNYNYSALIYTLPPTYSQLRGNYYFSQDNNLTPHLFILSLFLFSIATKQTST